MSKVIIQIVTYNSEKFLAGCLKSILDQTFRDFQVLVIDNNSQDDTVKYIKNNFPEVTVFQNHKNVGFSKAHNQGIKLLSSKYVLFMNPDIVLEPNFLEKTIQKAEDEKYKKYASFGGKLLKLKVIDYEIGEFEKTTTIDSLGIKKLKNSRFVELGAGENSSDYVNNMDVFGHSGSLVLYRRSALENLSVGVKDGREYFDEDFFFYKEDIDLAWRAQILGWKSMCICDAIAYHVRSMAGSEKTSRWDLVKNKKNQSKLAKYYSYRNHFLLIIKNLSAKEFKTDFFPIVWFELQKFVYTLFFEIKNIKAVFETIGLWKKMRTKRKQINRKMLNC